MSSVLRIPACPLTVTQADTRLDKWSERDRAHICLSRKDRDGDAGENLIEWWDEAVAQAVEDGFLNPRDWHGSAFAYAREIGVIKPLVVDFSTSWVAIVADFVRKTPSRERPRDHTDRLEWFADKAREVAETVASDRQFAALSSGQVETVIDTVTAALYEQAIEAENKPKPLQIEIAGGPLVVETNGSTLVLRGGHATGSSFIAGKDREAAFSLRWFHEDGSQHGDFSAVFGRDSSGWRKNSRAEASLKGIALKAVNDHASEIEDFLRRSQEWNALMALEKALDLTIEAGAPRSAEAQENNYDRARLASLGANHELDDGLELTPAGP